MWLTLGIRMCAPIVRCVPGRRLKAIDPHVSELIICGAGGANDERTEVCDCSASLTSRNPTVNHPATTQRRIYMRKKLKLDLSTIEIESFLVDSTVLPSSGTVHAHHVSEHGPSCGGVYNTCYDLCPNQTSPGPCAGYTQVGYRPGCPDTNSPTQSYTCACPPSPTSDGCNTAAGPSCLEVC